MDTRQRILSSVCNGLLNIKSDNGYNNTIAEVKKGFYKQTAISNYPTACVYFGMDILAKQIEGEAFGESTLDVFVVIYLKSMISEQVNDAERMIEDLYKYFNRHESINQSYVSGLENESYVQNYFIWKTNPYVSGTDTVLAIGIILKVEYMNFVDTAIPA